MKSTDNKKINAATIIKETAKIIMGNPTEANAANLILQMRIKKNIHFMIHFTPSGHFFREKLQRNPELILNS